MQFSVILRTPLCGVGLTDSQFKTLLTGWINFDITFNKLSNSLWELMNAHNLLCYCFSRQINEQVYYDYMTDMPCSNWCPKQLLSVLWTNPGFDLIHLENINLKIDMLPFKTKNVFLLLRHRNYFLFYY